jgi:hypothetical protein
MLLWKSIPIARSAFLAYTYLEITGLGLSTSQSLTDAVRQVFGLAARDGADSLLLELDGHDGCELVGPRGWEATGDGVIPGTPASGVGEIESIKWRPTTTR